MAPMFEFMKKPNAVEEAVPLEAQIPRHREQAGRHMASRAFLDGFSPLEKPESLFESLRGEMNEQIIEQPQAIDAIISALDRSHVRNDNDKRPIATLAFLGPTGVGKSQTAKVLSNSFGSTDAKLLKIDCSNFSSGHEVASLTGSPPGYVGRGQEPLLNKKNVEAFGTVVLFDEIEKGSSELNNLLLQIMEDGELRLNDGNVTSFRDAIIILTSNLGAKELGMQMSSNSVGFGSHEAVTDTNILNKTATKAFEDYFPPEFSNRLDKLVVFHPLSPKGMAEVLAVKLNAVNAQYEDEYGIRISLTDATIEHLVGVAHKQPHFGARPMVRAFEESIQTTFGRYTGSEEVGEGTHIRVFHRDEFPEDYNHQDDRELIFAAKTDATIKRKVKTDVMLFTPPSIDKDIDDEADGSQEMDPDDLSDSDSDA